MNGGVAAGLWRHQTWSPSCIILYSSFSFFGIKNRKNMYFNSQMAWPPVTYDVISRNHSNWPSQNYAKDKRTAIENFMCWDDLSFRKKAAKP